MGFEGHPQVIVRVVVTSYYAWEIWGMLCNRVQRKGE